MKILKTLQYLIVVFSISAISCNSGSDDSNKTVIPNDTIPDSGKIEKLNEQIKSDAGNPELHYERAKIYVTLKKYQEAFNDIEIALSIDSTQSEYYLTLADINYAGGRIYKAKDALLKVVELDNENVKARIKLAEIYLILRDHKSSVLMSNEVLKLDQNNLTAYFIKGMNFKELGDTVQAVSDFQKILEIDPSYYNAHMQLGVVMHAQNNPAAEGYFANAIRLNPESEEALYGRALWFQGNGQLNNAIQDYTTIITLNFSNKNAHFNLGYIHQIELKIYDQAIKHYSDALKADAQYAEAYYNRGLCYETIGNLEASFRDYQAALTLRPGYIPAEDGIARVSR